MNWLAARKQCKSIAIIIISVIMLPIYYLRCYQHKTHQHNSFEITIVYICSILGHRIPDVPIPLFNVYPASKFALTALSQTLRQELTFQRSNIKLTVCMNCMYRSLTMHAIAAIKIYRPIYYWWWLTSIVIVNHIYCALEIKKDWLIYI